MRRRHQRQARNIKRGADHHDGAKAVAHRERAGERLQKSPGKVLHRDRKRKVGNGDADIMRQGLQEDAEALPEAHAEREHHGCADQDRKRRSQGSEKGHVGFFFVSCLFLALKSRLELASGLDYTGLCN
jgi:hypothetical protein